MQNKSTHNDKVTPIGRVLFRNGGVCIDFCNSGICFKTNEKVEIQLKVKLFLRMKVVIDDEMNEDFVSDVSYQPKTYSLNFEENKVIKLIKVNEALYGHVEFIDICSKNIESVLLEDKPRIEFIGDSLTCGFGNIGDDSVTYGDSSQTWCVEVANYLKCDYLTTSWSGIGLVKSSMNGRKNQIMEIRKRCIATDESTHYDLSQWKAKYVFINIGTNDYGTRSNDSFDLEFKTAMKTLITDCFACYGSDLVVFVVQGPVIEGHGKEHIKQNTIELKETFKNLHYLECFIDKEDTSLWGFQSHPNVEGHHQMANLLIPQIEETLIKYSY